MVDIIRKDNLTDLIHSQPTQSGSGNNTPTPPQQSGGNQGQPASQVVSSTGTTITLGQDNIKKK